MDATANDVPSAVSVPRFPTIYFFPAGDKQKMFQLRSYPTLEKLQGFIEAGLRGEGTVYSQGVSPIRIHDEL